MYYAQNLKLGIPYSSRFFDLDTLDNRLRRISNDGIYSSNELGEHGLFTIQLSKDPIIVPNNGNFLGAQVLEHFIVRNNLTRESYPLTIEHITLANFFNIELQLIRRIVEYLDKYGIPVMQDGKVKTQFIPEVYEVIAALKAHRENKDNLIMSLMPKVKFLAETIYRKIGKQMEIKDLVQYGVLGLLDAIEKYNPSINVKIETYASIRISGGIIDGMRSFDWVPRSVRRKKRNLDKAIHEAEQELGEPATAEDIAKKLNIGLNEFYKLIFGLYISNIQSIEEIIQHTTEEGERDRFRFLEQSTEKSPYDVLEKNQFKDLLAEEIEKLPEKQRIVIALYYLEDLNMKEIGYVFDVSESRVSQIHIKAMSRLRKGLKSRLR